MKRVYCDSNGYRKELKRLEKDGRIKVFMFPRENINYKINHIGKPSNETWGNLQRLKWGQLCTLNFEGSKYNEILQIIGTNNDQDTRHLDSAFKNQCDCFLTKDSTHIIFKKKELEQLLGFKIFHSIKDWKVIKYFLEN